MDKQRGRSKNLQKSKAEKAGVSGRADISGPSTPSHLYSFT